MGGIDFVDLYALYPRHDIDIDVEQRRLLAHDAILFQSPLFWYSTPSLVKEWIDLVLEHGFAYGHGGDKLAGKVMMMALSAAGPTDAYAPGGYQRYPLRTFLTPFEQTAHLCGMRFAAPYVIYGALQQEDKARFNDHVAGYIRLIEAIRDDRFDFETACATEVLTAENLPIREEP